MPLCFSYGINMDRLAMQARCSRSRVVGKARLAAHRFTIMENGYASVVVARGSFVHGLLWQLDLGDVAGLDRFEEVGRLYRKAMLPVLTANGPRQALVYIGLSSREGDPKPGYLEAVLRAADACDLPEPHRAELRRWLVPKRRPAGLPLAPEAEASGG